MSSRYHGGSSRYPSAYGHTPTYKSYSTLNPDGSMRDSITLTSGIDLGPSGTYAGVSAFNRSGPSSRSTMTMDSSDFNFPST